MPPTAFHESQRTYEQIERAAKDTLDKICEFDIKLCSWETLLNKYCVLNKNLETIQSLIKKDDSNFRMALLYPKDENVDNLVRITNILSVYTNDLQKTKETKELPQITSNNQLAYSLLNPSEQIEKRSNHDDIISSCSAFIKENWKFTQSNTPLPNGSAGNKKANTQQRPYSKLGECKELLTADQQRFDVSIRKQAKMRNNTLLFSMQRGTRLQNDDKTDIAHLKDAEKKSFAIMHVSKKPERKEEPFKVNLPVLTANNNNPPTQMPQPPPSGKIKISTVHNPSIPVKKEVETPGQESKRATQKKTTPVTSRQPVKKSPSVTAPSPTVKTPSPSTTANPSFIPPQGITPPITPQTPTAAAARARQTPQSATTTPKNIQSRPPAMSVNNMGTTASPTPGSNGRPQASPNANLQNQLFNMQQQMLRAGATPGSFPISPMVFRPQMNVANMTRGNPTPSGYPNVRFTGNPTQFAGPPYFQLLQPGQQQPQQQQQPPQQQQQKK
ncbi:hypothetical protein NAEGRDRAFT_79861 [Naegleria gruberi]|uniref:Uncharacterized protein n=1 Tax=Naegleria gruberi TaxID=5762 RepID=D2VG75_NAEGR|nr:uncharacterized protein NAEGRDRAFT_79861 [Naegleria gruberi]EFC44300.1 hypothetical protein NAEGRDRAFT_79861 [Naegleria gruberi]|eukprot:XP_002677044.1 hypothetical protein NAEGRDRAFT_79861 [Naegleria gruberi strain NEG-M]